MARADTAFTATEIPPAERQGAVPRSKRLFDVGVASLAIVLLAPVFVLSALLVAATSRGPVLYRQPRYGHDGRIFTILKFRTMVEGADERIEAILADPAQREHFRRHAKLPKDPRVTRTGRLLRWLSIDELPQLFNVLRGDMSLVGPRPRWAAEELDGYGADLEAYFSVLPGLTGPWQVSGRNRLPDEERVRLDVAYAHERTLTGDVWLIIRTLPVLAWPFRRGAA